MVSANDTLPAERAFVEVWSEGQLEVAQEIFSSDYVNHDPVSPEIPPGSAGVRALVAIYRTAFPDLRFTIEDMVTQGDKVVTRWTARGTHKGNLRGLAPTGRRAEVSGITIHRMAQGKIAETWVNWDTLGLLQQIGAVWTPPTVGSGVR